jgi:hypothetical protein
VANDSTGTWLAVNISKNLSNLKVIAKALNAKLLINSDYKGTTFGFALPVFNKTGSDSS